MGIEGNGVILKWDSSTPIVYKIDPGTLGTRDHEDGAQLVRDAFGWWEAVETSTIDFEDGGKLDVDVDETNFMPFFDNRSRPYPSFSMPTGESPMTCWETERATTSWVSLLPVFRSMVSTPTASPS